MHHEQAKVGHCTNKNGSLWSRLRNYVKLLALNCSELSKTLEILSINCGQLFNNYEDTCMYTDSVIDQNYNENLIHIVICKLVLL